MIQENTISESSLDPINQTLCQDIFIGPDYKVMKTKVKNQVLDNIYNWLKKMGYDYEQVVLQIRLEGSSAGFQYTSTSDLDVSLITNIPDNEIDKLWKILPNGQKLQDTQMEINYYLLRSNEHDTARDTPGIYDIINDKWIKEPSIDEVKKRIPFSYVIEVAKFFTAGVDDRLNEYNSDLAELDNLKKLSKAEVVDEERERLIAQKETEIKADLDSLYVAHCMLKSLRHQAFGSKDGSVKPFYPIPLILKLEDTEKYDSPDSSISNLVYKMIERLGYFEKLEKCEKERDKINN